MKAEKKELLKKLWINKSITFEEMLLLMSREDFPEEIFDSNWKYDNTPFYGTALINSSSPLQDKYQGGSTFTTSM